MKKALAESERLDAERKDAETEEEEQMRVAIEMSMREEAARNNDGEEGKLEEQHYGQQ